MTEPPEDTRAYFRGRCLAKYAAEVVAASWDSVIFDVGRESLVRVPMMEPERGTKKHVGRAVRPVPQRQGPARGAHRPADARRDVASRVRRRRTVGLLRSPLTQVRSRQRECEEEDTMATRDTGGQSQSGKARRDEEIDEAPAPRRTPRSPSATRS